MKGSNGAPPPPASVLTPSLFNENFEWVAPREGVEKSVGGGFPASENTKKSHSFDSFEGAKSWAILVALVPEL